MPSASNPRTPPYHSPSGNSSLPGSQPDPIGAKGSIVVVVVVADVVVVVGATVVEGAAVVSGVPAVDVVVGAGSVLVVGSSDDSPLEHATRTMTAMRMLTTLRIRQYTTYAPLNFTVSMAYDRW